VETTVDGLVTVDSLVPKVGTPLSDTDFRNEIEGIIDQSGKLNLLIRNLLLFARNYPDFNLIQILPRSRDGVLVAVAGPGGLLVVRLSSGDPSTVWRQFVSRMDDFETILGLFRPESRTYYRALLLAVDPTVKNLNEIPYTAVETGAFVAKGRIRKSILGLDISFEITFQRNQFGQWQIVRF
jgi:hypothetical protein